MPGKATGIQLPTKEREVSLRYKEWSPEWPKCRMQREEPSESRKAMCWDPGPNSQSLEVRDPWLFVLFLFLPEKIPLNFNLAQEGQHLCTFYKSFVDTMRLWGWLLPTHPSANQGHLQRRCKASMPGSEFVGISRQTSLWLQLLKLKSKNGRKI